MTPVSTAALVACAALAAGALWAWNSGRRDLFLPGATSHGHYQIELACNACHDAWNGVAQDACTGCHGAELAAADDSHPKAKFTDPRNAALVSKVEARLCVTCHIEHRPERTLTMGVTQPLDYCIECHEEIGEERPSHAGMAFTSCRDAGCHNFHDNRALSADFLEQHLDEPALREAPRVPTRRAAGEQATAARLSAFEHDAPEPVSASEEVVHEWAASAHAKAGVNCRDCHGKSGHAKPGDAALSEGEPSWIERPDHTSCERCHEEPVAGFLAGKHGMRLAHDLSPMAPERARAAMREAARGRTLSCNSCHGAHAYDRRHAQSASCLGCHADEHSLAYSGSRHAELLRAEHAGEAEPGTGVSCATCHMPRVSTAHGTWSGVVHNQNDNLRPNDKMIRSVCLSCHGLGFALDALADRELVQRNFQGRPARHVQSIDMVARKLASLEGSRAP